MAETPSHSFGEILSRFVKLLGEDPAFQGKDPADLQAEAMRRAKETLGRREASGRQRHEDNQRKRQAKEWAERMKSADAQKQESARKDARSAKYEKGLTPDVAAERRAEVELVLDKNPPAWLEADKLTTAEGIDFATKITELVGAGLENNPDVLLHEAAKKYWSMDWYTANSEAVREVRGLLDKTFQQVRAKGGAIPENPDSVITLLDNRPEIYRTKRLEEISEDQKARKPPYKDEAKGTINPASEEFIEWRNKRAPEVQQEQLDKILRYYQEQLDIHSGNPEELSRLLRDLEKSLREGSIGTRSFRISDDEHRIKYDIPSQFNKAQVQPYLNEVVSFSTRVEEYQETTKQINRDVHQAELRQKQELAKDEEEKKRIIETGMGIVYTADELEPIFHSIEKRIRQEGEVLPYSRELIFSKEDWDLLKKGPEGWFEWLAEFKRTKTAKDKPFEMTLYDQSRWDTFKNIVKWLVGDEESKHYISLLEGKLNLYQNADAYVYGVDKGAKRKVEDFTNPNRWMNTAYQEQLRQTETVEIAIPHFRDSIGFFVGLDESEYYNTLRELLADCKHPFDGTSIKKNGENFKNNDFLDLLLNAEVDPGNQYYGVFHRDVSYDKLVEGYNAEVAKAKQTGQTDRLKDLLQQQPLSEPEVTKLRRDIPPKKIEELRERRTKFLQKVDRVGSGIMLRDEHMLAHWNDYEELVAYQKEYITLTNSDKRDTKTVNRLNALKLQIKERWENVTLNPNTVLDPMDQRTVTAVKGMSPVEIETRVRVLDQLRFEMAAQHPTWTNKRLEDELVKMDWKIYEAVWAARASSIGRGEAMEIAAKLARSSSLDLKFKVGRGTRVEHFMDRGWAEAWLRGLNPSLFSDDFTMGGPVGDDIRNIKYSNAFRIAGYDWKKDVNLPKEYKDKLIKLGKGEHPTPEWVVLMEYATDVLGMDYSEVIRPEMLATGLQNLSSSWRMEKAALDKIRDDFLRHIDQMQRGANPEVHALGLRLAAAQTPEEKVFILKRMVRRLPLEFVNLLGTNDLRSILLQSKADITFNSAEWQIFNRTMAIAQVETWRNEKLKFKEFDFTKRSDFNKVMPAALKSVLHNGLSEPELNKILDKHFAIIQGIQKYMESPPGVYGPSVGPGAFTRIDRWARHPLKQNFMLGMSQLDYKKDVDFTRIGLFSLERRINDYVGQTHARDLEYEIYYTSPHLYLYPPPGKEADAFLKIAEYRDAIIGYAGLDDAERAQAVMLETMFDWNFNQESQTLAGWVPGMVSLMRRSSTIQRSTEEVGLGDPFGKALLGIMKIFPSGREFIESHHLEGRHSSEWPKAIGQLVSYDVKHGGFEGNAWDEPKMAGAIATVEQLKMFKSAWGEKQFRRLAKKYKTGIIQRMFIATPRKYWWIIPIATIALASMQSLEEEKKK